MRRKEFAARVWSKLMAFEKGRGLLPAGRRVLAAVSGGPDSVVLAHWLSVQARRKGLTVALLHVNHGLRGKAAERDAEFVRRLGARLGLRVAVVRADVAGRARKDGLGLEEAGRKERYRALLARARRGRFDAVATGHQLDDQAETLLLHLLRGTSLEGLGGIPPRRPLAPGVELIRPLLPLSRAEIMAYLEVHGLEWRDDRSNRDAKFTRNWVRRDVLPLLEARAPGFKDRLSEIAAKVRAATGRA
ncbi:MAG TPA: tRNA lysidine(34) synthetase TilS [Elusimicrobiota bacterium]|jgi:tRNA(Ile)-lysidine synthase|nr:tRNA lysidine(34) synthetase TilS [Elusimicrobiota bacterium]